MEKIKPFICPRCSAGSDIRGAFCSDCKAYVESEAGEIAKILTNPDNFYPPGSLGDRKEKLMEEWDTKRQQIGREFADLFRKEYKRNKWITVALSVFIVFCIVVGITVYGITKLVKKVYAAYRRMSWSDLIGAVIIALSFIFLVLVVST